MRDPEYDRFGPWAMEITEKDPPPPLFLPYLTRDKTPLISIKIPRSIERRKVRPGMNLYDYMVCLYADDLVILQRVGDDVRPETFSYRDIHCLRYAEDLLMGKLQLLMTGQVYDLPFNTVSKELMRHLVEMIRSRYTDDSDYVTLDPGPDVPHDDLSFFFTNLFASEKAQTPILRLLASQVDTPVGGQEARPVRKILFGAIGKTLLESLHLCDGRELKIIDRGQAIKYKWQAVYGTRVTYVPLSEIIGVGWMPDPNNGAIVNLNLEIDGGSLSFSLLRDNPSIPTYADFLSAVTTLSDQNQPASVNEKVLT